MELEEIKKILPQREPLLMVDDILELTAGERVLGYKKVGHNEFWTEAHFPGNPVFPGVLLIEHMAQVSLFLIHEEKKTLKKVYLAKVDQVKFFQPVLPGAELFTEVKKEIESGGFVKVSAVVYIDKERQRKAASGKLTCYAELEETAGKEGGL